MSCGKQAELSGKSGGNGKSGADSRQVRSVRKKRGTFAKMEKTDDGRGRLRYVLFCRAGKKKVDGSRKACYTIIRYLTVLVWLSWQSSSLVMSRSLMLYKAAIAFRPTGVVN